MDSEFGYGTIGVVAVCATGIGWLLGAKGTEKKATQKADEKAKERLIQGMMAAAEGNMAAGSDLDEDERRALFGMLNQHANRLEVDTDLSIPQRFQQAAKDLLSRAGVDAYVSGDTTDKGIAAALAKGVGVTS